MEEVSEFTYLGNIVSFKDRRSKELKAGKKRAWGGFWTLRQEEQNETFIKEKILESCQL